MLVAIVSGIAAYFFASFVGYVVHWVIHQPWAGKAFRAHRAHHIDLYPPKDLVSDVYRSAGHQSTVYTFLLAFAPIVLFPVVAALLGWVSVTTMLCVIGSIGVVGLLNDVIHDSYHVRDHWLARWIPGYAHRRALHFAHHANMKKNFGIYSFTCDRIFRTVKK